MNANQRNTQINVSKTRPTVISAVEKRNIYGAKREPKREHSWSARIWRRRGTD